MRQVCQARLTIVLAVMVLVRAVSSGGEKVPDAVRNVEAFARLYGYIRYFHPSDEASKVDWDRFAVYGVKRAESAKNSQELKEALEELFLPLAPSMEVHHSNEKEEFDESRIIPPDKKNMRVVAWQHYGLGLTSQPGKYRSIRLNRKSRMPARSSFGNLMKKKPAEAFAGREFLFKAAVKVESGKAQLWFRVDRPNGKMGFFDNMHDRPIASRKWKVYEIRGKIAEDAENIAYGCFLPGSGKIFADAFRFLVKEGNQWKPVEIDDPGFEADAEGKRAKDWIVRGLDYDFQATAQTASEGSKSLMIQSKASYAPERLFPEGPSVGEHINKRLGSGLSCIMPLALYGTETQTYPAVSADAFENLQAAIEKQTPQKLSANDLYIRWADVVIAWNVFQHFYPYFDVVKVDWSSVLSRTLVEAMTDKDEDDFSWTLRKMVAQLEDGHANVYRPTMRDQGGLPFKLEYVENQVVVVSSKHERFQRGDIIICIDGLDAKEALLERETCISGSPQWKRKRSLMEVVWGKRNTKARLKIKRDKKMLALSAVRSHRKQVTEFQGNCVEEVRDNIYYVDLGNWSLDKEFKASINRLAKAKGVVFDARGYVTTFEVLSHLIDETIASAWWNIPKVIYPDRENIAYAESNWKVEPKKPKIRGKVVFLTDANAISASETFMGIVEYYKLGEIVGQPTAGTNGNVNRVYLLGGYWIPWTGMRVLKHDHSQHHLIGIQPTVPMKRTLKGVREGRDEFLGKAIEIIESS
jgi:C-terminal processing protease CtpA/Prc